jgi:hypothetical protein
MKAQPIDSADFGNSDEVSFDRSRHSRGAFVLDWSYV